MAAWKYRKEIEDTARVIDKGAWVPPDTREKMNRRLAARDEARRRIAARDAATD